ncbi:MAG: oligosaccharide flippase family protein [Phototrophicaceae bacterium]
MSLPTRSHLLRETLLALILLICPLILFWQQTLGGRTLLPTENLYQFEPYATYQEVVNAPSVPYNALVSDLVLQNLQWKAFIKANLEQGEVPLWNPYQLGGIPFMAAGQPSTLYPLNLIYYVLPIEIAYGWFTVINLWLCGWSMSLFVRALGVRPLSAVVSGVTWQLCGFLVAGAVFPMMLGAAVWIPLLLLMSEFIIRREPIWGREAVIPWVVLGAGILGMNIFAGHVEITYYTILITVFYSTVRVIALAWDSRHEEAQVVRGMLARFSHLAVMGLLGISIGAMQFIPLYELVSTNWRADGATFQETLGYAHPMRDLIQYLMPNFYGSPAQHTYWDVFTGRNVPVTVNSLGQAIQHTDWGIKNYVEGALYVGILPLVLMLYALMGNSPSRPPYRGIFVGLGLISLSFMFGLPTYALLYYGLPGLNQAHTPFRWVLAVTLTVAVLAGFGMDQLIQTERPRLKRWLGWGLIVGGCVLASGLGLGVIAYAPIAPLVERIFLGLAKATTAFPDAQAFYSHLVVNGGWLALMMLASGGIILLAKRGIRWVTIGAITLTALDLIVAHIGFNPRSDPALLHFTPPMIEWLQGQPHGWRYITLDDPNQRPLMHANLGWQFGLEDVRGYESIIPRQYVDYMRQLAPQVQLDYNRIAPLYTVYPSSVPFDYRDALTHDRLHLLNVRYVITHRTTDLSDVEGYSKVYADEAVNVWENSHALPRAYFIPTADKPTEAVVPSSYVPAGVISTTGREVVIDLQDAPNTSWLVISQSYFTGWRAYLQTVTEEGIQQESTQIVERVQDNFMGIALRDVPNGATLRLVYSPLSFQVGLFSTLIGGLVALLLGGVWAWQRFVIEKDTDGKALLARNSFAPIVLNLFNRGIDFVFAFVMLRILGPADTGIYAYAGVVFVWFDIFTNFGLDLYIMREVGRNRARAAELLVQSSVFRLCLSAVGIGLLLSMIAIRQNWGTTPFDPRGITALLLLYGGLLPSSLSKGMTSLYYAFERAEYPSAVQTVTTVSKAVLGLIALIGGYGIIGLASVSIFNNFVTLAILAWGGRDMFGRLRFNIQLPLIAQMARESYPLLLNHFLATIFFQIDVVILELYKGVALVGKYSVGYRWLLGLNIIPAFFTQALFARLSRHAQDDRPRLKLYYHVGLKLLALVVFPIAVVLTFSAEALTLLLGGQAFLPEGAIALQIMLWSMPIGWMNSLTQYVLIALNKQRQLTWAFALGVTFNIVTNLIFIPRYSYVAAGITTILSELILLVGFSRLLMSEVGWINWFAIWSRPMLGAGVMAGILALLWEVQPLGALVLAIGVYPLVVALSRPFTPEEFNLLSTLFPRRTHSFIRRWMIS